MQLSLEEAQPWFASPKLRLSILFDICGIDSVRHEDPGVRDRRRYGMNLPHYDPAIELGRNHAMRFDVIDEDVTQDDAGVHNVRTIRELGKSVTAGKHEIVC